MNSTKVAPTMDSSSKWPAQPEVFEGAPLRTVLIGAGAMARHHARAIQRLPNRAVLVGFVDPSAEARAGMAKVLPGLRSASSLAELLRELGADVAHICTPPRSHASATRAALASGLHVYVEKPFAETLEEATSLLRQAEEADLKICAGHQLLFEPPTQRILELLPALRTVVHVESYFSFKPARGQANNQTPLPAHLQLLDVLPHPVYLLVRCLEAIEPGEPAQVVSLHTGPAGTAHLLIRAGSITSTLTITLEGRPVDSYLRIVGSNGSLHADYIRGTVQRALGPGASGIDKALAPYRQARQLVGGTTRQLWNRVRSRRRSYPGLVEIFDAFYQAISTGGASPVSAANIRATTAICQRVALAIQQPSDAPREPRLAASGGGRRVLVTGGTGFLGKAVARRFVEAGWGVRVVSRREPAPWDRVPEVEYHAADLSAGVPEAAVAGAHVLVHCAAATSGGWEAHEQHSVQATRNVLQAAAAAGVDRILHVSSLAVQEARPGHAVSEQTPLVAKPRRRGPYVWGKLTSEVLARELSEDLGLQLRVARPGALLDPTAFDPPGRLGRRVGNLFVAVGGRADPLGVCEVGLAADAIVRMCLNWEDAPDTLNVLAPELPRKRDLVRRLRASQPELSVVWLPSFALKPLSVLAILLQKILRPNAPAVNAAKVFAPEAYDTVGIRRFLATSPPLPKRNATS